MWYSKERVHDDYQAIEYVDVVLFRLCYSLMSIVLIITYMTSLCIVIHILMIDMLFSISIYDKEERDTHYIHDCKEYCCY